MTFSVEQLADLPIVILRLHADFDAETQLMDAIDAADVVMLRINTPVYYICDATLAPKPTFKGVIEGSNAVVKRSNFNLIQSMIQEVLLIAPNKVMQMVAKGLNTEAFGWLHIKVFDSYDGALDYLRDKLAESIVE
jgi:hypothetical protein